MGLFDTVMRLSERMREMVKNTSSRRGEEGRHYQALPN